MKDKTLKVKESTYAKLTKLAAYGDSMDDIINRLLEKKQTRKETA